MISHTLKCIFVHIPRCAGSSIETWLCGTDWWNIDPKTKHLLASQAFALYQDYWDEYYKFSIVRHPYSRVASCLHHREYFGLDVSPTGNLDFGAYHQHFGNGPVVEYDYRFYSYDEVSRPAHERNQIYGNVLDVPLDKIFKFEDLASAVEELRDILEVPGSFSHHIEKSRDSVSLSESSETYITELYAKDFGKYGYDKKL